VELLLLLFLQIDFKVFSPSILSVNRFTVSFAAMPCRAIHHVSALGVEWVKGLGGGGVGEVNFTATIEGYDSYSSLMKKI